jgi:hypothetical protein
MPRMLRTLDRFACDKDLPHLGKAFESMPVGRKAHTAAVRIGATATDQPPVEPY